MGNFSPDSREAGQSKPKKYSLRRSDFAREYYA